MPRPQRRARIGARFASATAAGLAAVLLLAGCSSDPLAEQYREGSGKNYIAGDGSVAEFAADQRGEPVSFEGTTVDGGTFDSADSLGEVTVVNFWYAGCAPCRVEAPILQQVHEDFGDDVTFVGVNVRDQAGTARPFEEDFGITYPSILDVDEGRVQYAFAGKVPAAAVPTTLVLDQEGRVAARILGQIEDDSILSSIVGDLVAEGA
ncbi:TlpA disulfide reductase family protein [Agromyces sp. G08B096]|uniref:TlpA family protein disulfide reductase n=1 Tax=Agromyces sp. G08B096 TaxID=3156399 RepID=UPI0033137AAA